MGRDKHPVVTLLLIVSLVLAPLLTYAAPPVKPGDTAQNLKVVPPWTMRLCTVGARLQVLQAVYGREDALKLKLLDTDCALWQSSVQRLKKQTALHKETATAYQEITLSLQKQLKAEQTRNADLLKDIKKEIKEKNEYKYKPSYGWVGWVVGGGVALVALGVLTGVLVSSD